MGTLVTEESGFDLAKNQSQTIDSKTIRLVNDTIQAAYDRGASDIHFETTPTGGLWIRFRVDGICHTTCRSRRHARARCIRASRSWRSFNIAEHRLPQDGKIRLKDKRGRKTDLARGDHARPRRLRGHGPAPAAGVPGAETRSDRDGVENLERFRKVIEQPHGIVLCVGPTGSGKTTTLHARRCRTSRDRR